LQDQKHQQLQVTLLLLLHCSLLLHCHSRLPSLLLQPCRVSKITLPSHCCCCRHQDQHPNPYWPKDQLHHRCQTVLLLLLQVQ
jgi:hypothetical protein